MPTMTEEAATAMLIDAQNKTAINLNRYLSAAHGVLAAYLKTKDLARRQKLYSDIFKAISRAMILAEKLERP